MERRHLEVAAEHEGGEEGKSGGSDHEERGTRGQDKGERGVPAADRAEERELNGAGLDGGRGERPVPLRRQERAAGVDEHVRVTVDEESLVERSDRRSRRRQRPGEDSIEQPELSCETPPHTELIGMRTASFSRQLAGRRTSDTSRPWEFASRTPWFSSSRSPSPPTWPISRSHASVWRDSSCTIVE